MLSHISLANNNNYSIISDSYILCDISDTPIVNNWAEPEIYNFSKKVYENGVYQGSDNSFQ